MKIRIRSVDVIILIVEMFIILFGNRYLSPIIGRLPFFIGCAVLFIWADVIQAKIDGRKYDGKI